MSATAKIKEWFQRGKDSSVSFVLEKVLAKQLEPYGQLLAVKIDSERESAELHVLLKGEAEAISLFIEKYDLELTAEGTFLRIRRISASREWISKLLTQFLTDQRFPIPDKYARIARFVL
jgi:hypothetical protein